MVAQPRGWLVLPLNSILSKSKETTLHDGAAVPSIARVVPVPDFRLVPAGAAGSGAPQAAGGLRLQPFLFLLPVVHCFWMVQCKPASHVPGGSPRPVDVGRHWVSAAWLDHVAEPMFHAARTWVTRPGSTLRRFWPWFSCAALVPAARSGLSTWGDTGSPRRGSSTSPSPCSTRHGPGCPDQGPR